MTEKIEYIPGPLLNQFTQIGCARHWHEKGIQTELSIERILELIGKNASMAA
ncbi:MAG: hypothetical protein GX640_03210 [Fibrobacter sp.]|nr:hypothetical protein [Fibrobacter sp.]